MAFEKLSRLARKATLDKSEFWLQVQKLQNLIKPLVKLITVLESSQVKISPLAECFMDFTCQFT